MRLSPTWGREAAILWTVICVLPCGLGGIPPLEGVLALLVTWAVPLAAGALPWLAGAAREDLRVMGGCLLVLQLGLLALMLVIGVEAGPDPNPLGAELLMALVVVAVMTIVLPGLAIVPWWLIVAGHLTEAPRVVWWRELARVLTIGLPLAVPAGFVGAVLCAAIREGADGAGWPLFPLVSAPVAGALTGAGVALGGALALRLRRAGAGEQPA